MTQETAIAPPVGHNLVHHVSVVWPRKSVF